MAAPRIYRHQVTEGADWQPMDLFAYGDGVLPLTADIDDIDIRIFKSSDRTALYESLGLAPGGSGPFYDTPVLDAGWKLGPPGYNFKLRLEMAVLEALPVPVVFETGQRYRLEVTLNGTNEGRLISVHEYQIMAVYGQS